MTGPGRHDTLDLDLLGSGSFLGNGKTDETSLGLGNINSIILPLQEESK
jgi:hypothetical protein